MPPEAGRTSPRFRGVEILPHRRRVGTQLLGLTDDAGHGAVCRQHQALHTAQRIDLRRQQLQQFRGDGVDVVQVGLQLIELAGDLIETVLRTQSRRPPVAHRGTGLDVVAALAIQILIGAIERVVDLGDLVTDLFGDVRHLAGDDDHAVCLIGDVLHQRIRTLHGRDGPGQVIGLRPHFLQPGLHECDILLLPCRLHAEQ